MREFSDTCHSSSLTKDYTYSVVVIICWLIHKQMIVKTFTPVSSFVTCNEYKGEKCDE